MAGAQGQLWHHSADQIPVADSGKKVLTQPWAGGMLNPQLGDFSIGGQRYLLSFESTGNDDGLFSLYALSGGIYKRDFSLDKFFPRAFGWVIPADYDRDGNTDLFTYSVEGGGIDVYRNTGVAGPGMFKKVSQVLPYGYYDRDAAGNKLDSTFSNVFSSIVDRPSITDMDGDGDLDILAVDVFQSTISFFRNKGMEFYGTADSLTFRIADNCWGKFNETSGGKRLRLGYSCKQVKEIPGEPKKLHGGFSLLALDYDGDGDQDLLHGDLVMDDLTLLYNGRIRAGGVKHPRDTIVSYDSLFPSGTKPSHFPRFLVPYLADVDQDGKQDLIVSTSAYSGESRNINNVWYYRNESTGSGYKFSFKQEDLLQGQMLHFGFRTAPALGDLDGDGLADLLVATSGDYARNKNASDRIDRYTNKGTATSPKYEWAEGNFLGYEDSAISLLMPSIGDADGDGDNDIVIGRQDGRLSLWLNNGKGKFTPSNALSGIDVGQNSAPAIADVDGDGKADLIIGEYSGLFNFYQGDGGLTWTLKSENYGKVRTNDFYYDYTIIGRDTLDSVRVMFTSGSSAPAIADFDGDGQLDMMSGSSSGRLFLFRSISADPNLQLKNDSSFMGSGPDGPGSWVDFGFLSTPAIADLNGDLRAEVVCGSSIGGLRLITSLKTVGITPRPPHRPVSAWYDASADGFRVGGPVPQTVYAIGMDGRQLPLAPSGNNLWRAQGLADGAFVLMLTFPDGRTAASTVVGVFR